LLILPIHEVESGMKLAMSVMNPRKRDHELLRAGYVLEHEVIARLKSMDVQHVFVEFEGLDDLDRILAPLLSRERLAIYQTVKTVIGRSEQTNRPVVKYALYKDVTRDLIRSMLTDSANAMMLDLLSHAGGEVEHATAVAHVALALGLKLDAYLIRERPRLNSLQARDVTNLGIAAMLHDIGKSKLPKALQPRHVLDEFGDRDTWEEHVRLGYDMIRGEVDPTVAATVLHHHQRYDGNGFPSQEREGVPVTPSGDNIHAFARILCAADLFERLAEGPHGRRTNFETLHLLQTRYASWLDPDVLTAMPQVLPPFSPGRRVTLNNGVEGIVVGFHPLSPYQPVVKRMVNGKVVTTDEAIDLRDTGQEIVQLDGRPVEDLQRAASRAA
jgi:HD-GYP domain-containing protein (c-di-GMP phosphodiesterase class II)